MLTFVVILKHNILHLIKMIKLITLKIKISQTGQSQVKVFMGFWPNLVSISSKRIAKRMLLAQIKANYSSGADSSSDDENADKEDGDSTKKGKYGAKKQEGSGEFRIGSDLMPFEADVFLSCMKY